jgi:hypothetical protein
VGRLALSLAARTRRGLPRLEELGAAGDDGVELVANRVSVPRTPAIARAALQALGLTGVNSLRVAGGTATLDLTGRPTGLALAAGLVDVTVPFTDATPGRGKLVAYETSAENDQRIHVVRIPLVLP